MRVIAMAMVLLGLSSVPVGAQSRVDVGLLLGTTTASDEGAALQFDRATTYQATLAWRIWQNDAVRVAIEVPFIASPKFEVTTSGRSLPKEYASLYLTPGVRVVAFPDHVISVFGAAGAGYARYSESKLRADGTANPGQRDTNTDAIQLGGGIDIGALRWLGFRFEVRDLYTGARIFSIATAGARVHNIIGSGGLVLRF